MFRYMVSLTVVFAITAMSACSDDGDTPNPDTGTDMAIFDQSPGGEATPEASVDQAVSDTVATPDQPQGNPSDWTEVMAAPDILNGVWGLDANNVFTVGKGGAILKYDGTKWGAMTNPEKFDLMAIWGNATTVWAVGNGGDVYWDGTAWNKGYSGSSSYNLEDISGGSSYLFAAGGTSIYYRSMTSTGSLYWSSIYLSSNIKSVHGIWAVSDKEVYAVGDDGVVLECNITSGTDDCADYTSSNWAPMTTPTGATSHLQAIHRFSNKEMFAVGFDGMVLHYDGSKWEKMNLNTSSYFYGVWGSDPKDVWVVGHPIFKSDESVFHYDGTTWTKVPPPKTSHLNAVWGTSKTDVWAVGKSHILHYTGKKP